MVEDLLTGFVKEEWVQELDFSTLEKVNVKWLSGPEQDSLRRAFTVWFSRVLFPSRFDATAQPVMEDLTEVKNMLAERVKEWNQESMERGMQKGAVKMLLTKEKIRQD